MKTIWLAGFWLRWPEAGIYGTSYPFLPLLRPPIRLIAQSVSPCGLNGNQRASLSENDEQ